MSKWMKFENNCVNYLNKNYGNENIKFILKGKSDSTTSDIVVQIKGEEKFLIEIKMSKAQSGQFTVMIENNKFILSPNCKTPEDEYSKTIISYLNENFNEYKDVNTKGLKIDISSDYFSSWIVNYYKSKGVHYVMSEYNEEFIIFPIDKYSSYFEVYSNIRRKKSGSNNLPNMYINDVINHIKQKFNEEITIKSIGKKKILEIKNFPAEYKTQVSNINIYIKKIDQNYIITKLSNTDTPTVIFSIESKLPQLQVDLDKFKDELI